MPYINQRSRQALCAAESPLLIAPGELNYLITNLCRRYLEAQALGGEKSYTAINAVVGALECAKLELYRRVAAPYEDQKCKENGDVYVTKG